MSDGGRRVVQSVAKAALLIAVLTMFARLAGFGRIAVFARTVGATCLGDAYQSANTIPNIIFEIVAGGALASIVVPLLSASIATGDKERSSRTAAALLTWTIAVLTPLSIAVALLARPLAEALLGQKDCQGFGSNEQVVQIGASMLRVFAPQVVLYGVGIVLTGILQAHRKFGGPALAPLLSSLVVMGAYLTFGIVAAPGTDANNVTTGEQLILSVGTTLGVVVLSLSLLIPLRGTGLQVRPTFTFPDGIGVKARSMALSGVAALVAQQCSVAVALRLSNGSGVPNGSVAVLLFAQTMYLLPWALLAVPVATSVFPALSEYAAGKQTAQFSRQLSSSLGTIVALASVGTAVLIAAAPQIAAVLIRSAPGASNEGALSAGIAGFAIGLTGYALYALTSRALYALGDARGNAVAAVIGWAVVIGADLILAAAMPASSRVAALALGNSIGCCVLGLALLLRVARRSDLPLLRSASLAILGALVGIAAGWAVHVLPLPGGLQIDRDSTLWAALIAGGLRGLLAALVTVAILTVVPGMQVRQLLRRRTARP